MRISMKKNGLNNVSALLLTVSMFLPTIVDAGIVGKRTSGGGNSSSGQGSSGSGRIETKPGKPVDEKVDIKEGSASVSCKQDPDSSLNFPLDFFKQISRDGSPLSFEIREDNKILVKVPTSIDACGKFKPQMYQDPTSKNVTIMMTSDSGKTYGEVINCLIEKSMLKDGTVDHDTISGKDYSEYSYVLDYDFDKSKDIQKTLKLSFGYPKAHQGKDGYPSEYGKDSTVELPSVLCMDAEKISSSTVYLNKGKDALLEEFKATCNSRDAQRIAEARRSIGNAEALKDIADELKRKLDAAYLVAVKEDVDKIYKELGEIENFINTNKEMDEQTAKKKTEKYADLVKKLDEIFLNPAIYRLDTLMKNYAELEDGEAKTKMAEDIKKLNEDIATFAKRNSTSMINLYSLMEKYAITDSAKVIEGIRLKSFLYSKVFPAGKSNDPRGKALSFEEANKRQIKGEEGFDRTLTDWSDVYLVGQGNMVPIRKTEAERTRAISKMNSRWNQYQQNEYKNYNQYCAVGMMGSVKNPIQCQTFLKGVEQRRNIELKRRDRDLSYIKTRNDKLNKMGTSYNEWQKREFERQLADEDSFPYGSSYSGYETTFEERFPQYDSQSLLATTDGINGNMYSMMGGNPQMMGMGYQQQMQMPMMQQQYYNNGMNQYQYQMYPMMQ